MSWLLIVLILPVGASAQNSLCIVAVVIFMQKNAYLEEI
jgi:hypothetical protein